MYEKIIKLRPRRALGSTVDSTTYQTQYRTEFEALRLKLTTTDPDVAKLMAVGVLGLAWWLASISTTAPRSDNPRGSYG